ncbi:MAG TPA: acyl-CoA dehydrogenase [Candidatus Saccharimonadales bacterium]|nr:acyl-CoA dehydrogenase [Candidatus Saccharimonadales bacterium]
MTLLLVVLIIVLTKMVILLVPPLRRRLVTPTVMRALGRALPRMGETERIALEAGTVWWDGDLFSGRPDWKKLLDFQRKPLSARERAFLDGPVEELCGMVEEWKVERDADLPPEAWRFIKEKKFFGMIIPEEYGGLGFSALANSSVVTKLSSRSVTAAVTVMVPNSLGPAELLLHYGTEEQKRHFLPRLATAQEIPCFALTGPEAGSDAASTKSRGVVCRGTYQGREVLGMRLNWRKRYITLAPVTTLIGLAFRLYDPDHLIGEKEDLGITLALIPPDLPGIEIGKRHDPLGVPFLNGPIYGRDVFVPLDAIIGGKARVGQGWQMLMANLAAGRGISLPGLATGSSQLCSRVMGAYGTVREQFDLPIGRFEGIEEHLATIGGMTYVLSGARVLTAGAVDAGEKPAVISAIMKAYSTEAMRTVVNAAMDVQAGAGISKGPRNLLAQAYGAVPIGITVEGANILTRTLIIFGQGAIRCHPYVRSEMEAVARKDLVAFDRAFFAHVGFILSNAMRCFGHALTGSRFARPRGVDGPVGEYLARFTSLSAAFALVADAAMATLGGQLKRREKLSGRLADALAWLYLGSATVKKFWDDGKPEADLPFVQWGCEKAIDEIERALAGVLENLPNRPAAALLGATIFPLGMNGGPPSDALGAKVAKALLDDREERLRLTRDIYVPPPDDPGLGRLELALDKVMAAAPASLAIKAAVKERKLARDPEETLLERAVQAGVIDENGLKRIREAERARDDAIQVDEFDPGMLGRGSKLNLESESYRPESAVNPTRAR